MEPKRGSYEFHLYRQVHHLIPQEADAFNLLTKDNFPQRGGHEFFGS